MTIRLHYSFFSCSKFLLGEWTNTVNWINLKVYFCLRYRFIRLQTNSFWLECANDYFFNQINSRVTTILFFENPLFHLINLFRSGFWSSYQNQHWKILFKERKSGKAKANRQKEDSLPFNPFHRFNEIEILLHFFRIPPSKRKHFSQEESHWVLD